MEDIAREVANDPEIARELAADPDLARSIAESAEWYHHLHLAAAEVAHRAPRPARGSLAGITGTPVGDALAEAFEYWSQCLKPDQDTLGYTYRFVAELRDVCNALLRRHERWNPTRQ